MEPDRLKMLEDFGRIFERLEMMVETLEIMPKTSMDSMLEVRTQLGLASLIIQGQVDQ